MQQHESKPPPKCIYPQSNATARDIQTEIDAIAANRAKKGTCTLYCAAHPTTMTGKFKVT